MTRARRELVNQQVTPYYHCICRCVRRAFLCGKDSFSGKNYEHRREWVLERLRTLQSVFAIDLCAYAIMSNHYHLVIRLRQDQGEGWSEDEVVKRWQRLFSVPQLVARYCAGETTTKAEQQMAQGIIGTWRKRLVDLSWFMRCLNEDVARRANVEDGCKGRFWEGRFKSQALLDEGAILTCMTYVDLNPVRAGIADAPETSDFTSIQQRIAEDDKHSSEQAAAVVRPHLIPFSNRAATRSNTFPFSRQDYLELIDWAGRVIREDKYGAISSAVPPLLTRLRLDPQQYILHIRHGGRGHHVVALGAVDRLREAAELLGRRFLKGLGQSRRLYAATA